MKVRISEQNIILQSYLMINIFTGCPPGYYMDSETKRCVLECDICEDFNAEFDTCGFPCEALTCVNPLLQGLVCPDVKKCDPGCYCKAGYIKDTKTGKCIRPKSCPSKH